MTTTDAHARPDDTESRSEWGYETRLEQPLSGPTAPGSEIETDHAEQPENSEGVERDTRPARTPAEDRASDQRAKATSDGEAGTEDAPPPPPSKWLFVAVGLVLVALLAWGGYARWRRDSAASATQQATADAVPEVRTIEAKRDDTPTALTLPGQTEALDTANLYPRATGYISERRVDIGSRVKKGELLLHISAPDVDQQLAQAEAQVGQVKAAEAQAAAQVNQAEANLNLAKVTLARTATLTQQGYETLQNRDNQTANLLAQQANVDTAKSGVKVAEANTKAQLATVDRLKALTGFEDVIAPFDGVVTVRNVDVGDLVNADTSSATPLFSMARDSVIRVTVQVPQNAAGGVRNGLPAKIEVSQLPGHIFRGTVTRSSVALLSSARTLDTEVDIPNPDGLLRPGLFAYVTLDIPREHPNITVPAEALIFNQYGLQVATVSGDTAVMHSIKIDRDLGTSVELSEGLDGGEQVILSPPALLQPGAKVKIKPPETPKPDGGAQPGAQTTAGQKTGTAGDKT